MSSQAIHKPAKSKISGNSSKDVFRHSSKGTKKAPILTKFDHAQARLKWARAARDSKLEKIREVKSEMDALKKALDMKGIEIKMLKQEREIANERVKSEREMYREELVEVAVGIQNQTDPRLMDGFSSPVIQSRSSSVAYTRASSIADAQSTVSLLEGVEEEDGAREEESK